MLRTVFDHVINQIVSLVDKQIDEVQERGQRVKAILLVGGFGSNTYMWKRLKNGHRGDGIQVLHVNGASVSPKVFCFEPRNWLTLSLSPAGHPSVGVPRSGVLKTHRHPPLGAAHHGRQSLHGSLGIVTASVRVCRSI